eukprot:9484473-Pyramimonas_sp.AAC.1
MPPPHFAQQQFPGPPPSLAPPMLPNHESYEAGPSMPPPAMHQAQPQHGVLAEALAGVKRALMGQATEVRALLCVFVIPVLFKMRSLPTLQQPRN